MRRFLSIVAVSLVAAAPLALAEGLPDLGEKAQGDFSPQIEKKVGERIVQEIRLREPSYLDDPEIGGYLNRLGRRLAAQSDDARQEFEFFGIRDVTLNAFALPGGFIGVHTGLIVAAQSEAELASVLAHEISHVTQRHIARGLNKAGQGQIASLLAFAFAILAARHNPDLMQGAVVAGQAASIQNQLNYTRDFEREADRVGLQLLERAGFDIRGMAAFFERLQRFGRNYDNNAPAYLRTHPLTTERISDIENRIEGRPYRQSADSVDFQLVRAKLRSQEGTPQEAVVLFEQQLAEGKYSSESATRFGLAHALLRLRSFDRTEAELQRVRKAGVESSMLETLAADLALARGEAAEAVKALKAAHDRYPLERAISYRLVEAQMEANNADDALKTTIVDLQNYPSDFRMHALQAKSYAMMGKRLQQHRAQGESYHLQGLLLPAIEQFEYAQKSSDGDFYEHSQVDARLRQLKQQQFEELRLKRQ